MTEKQVVYSMNALTLAFCAVGVLAMRKPGGKKPEEAAEPTAEPQPEN